MMIFSLFNWYLASMSLISQTLGLKIKKQIGSKVSFKKQKGLKMHLVESKDNFSPQF
jgi:hypothetical protein